MERHNLSMRRYVVVSGIILAVASSVFAQTVPFRQLEEKVFQLNNALKYNQSQTLLLPVLDNDSFSAEEKYQAATLLSYTYKRVSDYESTLKFLAIARRFAQQTAHREQFTATILGQEAFVYFDTHNYARSDSLMTVLEASGFRYIDLENKSKLVMQQGYLLYLDKQYNRAEATYDKAIGWMRSADPCDLPMIYVKKMQLYAAMNRMDLLDGAFRQSTHYADSCAIIKYHIYANEELLVIYRHRNDLPGIVATANRVDSLNKIYDREVKLAALHNQKEAILLSNQNRRLKGEHNLRTNLSLILVGLGLVALALMGGLLIYRRQKRRADAEIRRMKNELETYLALSRLVPPKKAIVETRYRRNALSERQQEVLDYMARGMANKEIADKLCISENTVKYHIKNIYLLLEIKDRKDMFMNMRK